jgi:2-oxoglutarate ferredoxin oxidoreductase subunit alpha
MVKTRAAKVAAIAQDIPPTEIVGASSGELLVIGWGGTYGAITQAVKFMRERGYAVSSIHLRHLNPLPPDLGAIMGRFQRVLVPELNNGQLLKVLRADYLVDAVGLNKIQGKPFKVIEITAKIEEMTGPAGAAHKVTPLRAMER